MDPATTTALATSAPGIITALLANPLIFLVIIMVILVAFFVWFFFIKMPNSNNKIAERMDSVEERVGNLEQFKAKTEQQLNNMEAMLTDQHQSIEKLCTKIDNLVSVVSDVNVKYAVLDSRCMERHKENRQ